MSRAQESDFLQSFRFHVTADDAGGGAARFLLPSSTIVNGKLEEKPQAGFSAINTPSGTIDVAEYREGQYIYTRKYPGIPTMDDVTMSRGVALTDTEFFFWFTTAIEGNGEYRSDITIRHFHRGIPDVSEALQASSQNLNLDSTVRKQYVLHEAFPTAHKVAADLDSTASEVSIMDLTVSYERFSVVAGPVA